MLLALPIVAFLLLWGALSAREVGSSDVNIDRLRPAFLGAAVLWGTFLSLATELLSQFHSVTRPWLVSAWVVAIIGAGYLAWHSGALQMLRKWLSNARTIPFQRPAALRAVIAACLAGSLLLLAWISPPNNNDSLLYHMSRVAHWQQNASLAHYPAAYNTQLWAQIWAETAILNFKVLFGSDQASNLVQWFSMLGSILGVTSVAALLGVGRRGQWLTAAFLFSLPLGILESTSTQNDYVAAFWLISFVYFVVLAKLRPLTKLEWVGLTAALGLDVLTKATSYLYAFPVAAWLIVPGLSGGHTRKSILTAIWLGLGMLGLNLAYWVRNIKTFGEALGSAAWTQSKVVFEGMGQILYGPTRQILLNAATPSESLTRAIASAERSFEAWLGASGSHFSLTWAWNNEDYVGSPVHVLLIGICGLVLAGMWFKRRSERRGQLLVRYAVVLLASFLLFAWLSFYSAQNVRYQLSGFVFFAPMVGAVGDSVLKPRWTWRVIGLLGLLSLPWILFNQSRPMITWRPRTRVNSIFVESRERLIFANWPELEKPYAQMATLVSASACSQVGLVIDSHDKEYLIWSVLGAPENGMHLEILDPLSASSRYLDPGFAPCAVVCTICGQDRLDWGGLPFAEEYGPVRVYLAGSPARTAAADGWRP